MSKKMNPPKFKLGDVVADEDGNKCFITCIAHVEAAWKWQYQVADYDENKIIKVGNNIYSTVCVSDHGYCWEDEIIPWSEQVNKRVKEVEEELRELLDSLRTKRAELRALKPKAKKTTKK